MEVMVMVATILSFILVTFIIHTVIGKRAKNGNKREPPQAKGAWPIIGHLHLLGGSELPHKVLGDLADKYGPIFTMKLGIHQVVVVSNSEITKDCLTTNDKVLASRPKSEAVRLMAYNYAMFAFTPYGDYWRQVRKTMVLEVLSQRRVEMLRNIRVSELEASIKDLYGSWVENKESENKVLKVEMSQWFGNVMLNVMVRIISGKRFLPNDVHFQTVVREFFELLGAFVVADYIPYLKFLDLGGYAKAMKKTAKKFDEIFDGWLKEQRKYVAQEGGDSQVFMRVLVSILEGASKEDFPGFDQDTVIKATCQQLLVAGLDTTSLTLTWALSLLLNNPNALKIVQDEIDEHVGKDKLVEESDIKKLVYLDAVIKETLRLYPAAPLSVFHEAMEDCVVDGYNIQKGTRLLTNLWKIHHDPNVWSDPFEFRPERFLTSHKHIDVKGKHFELLPFGSGRRMCPGALFALQSIALTLASMLQQFEFQKPSNEPIDMTESAGMTNNKATPLVVLLSPRLSSNMYHVGS